VEKYGICAEFKEHWTEFYWQRRVQVKYGRWLVLPFLLVLLLFGLILKAS
jgi:hypothetical protein